MWRAQEAADNPGTLLDPIIDRGLDPGRETT
jgi:hypothetical protein